MLYLDIQMFANHVNVSTDVRTDGQSYPTYNDLSAEMKTYYDLKLLDEAGPNLVHDQFGQKRPIPAGNGKTIEFRKFTALPDALTPLTEGVTPDGQRLDVNAYTATVSQYGDYITQSDVLELTAIDNTIVEATKLLGEQAGITLDKVVRDALVGGTNMLLCPKWNGTTATVPQTRAGLDATAKLTVDMLEEAAARLKAQNARTFDGYFVAIAHPYVIHDIRRDPEWIDAHKYASPEELYTGEVGRIAGIRFVESTNAKIWKGGTSEPSGLAVFATLIFGRDAYGVTEVTGGGLQTIVKQKGSAGTADPLDQRSSVGWKATRVAEILNNAYMIRLESCSPKFSSIASAN